MEKKNIQENIENEKLAKRIAKKQSACLTLTPQYEEILIELAALLDLSKSETLEIAIRRLYDNI